MENKALKGIFSSGTRIKIMSLYFLNPGAAYYARQLEKTLKTPVGQLRRELINLENIGLLLSSKEGNQKRYRVNRQFVIHDELRDIFLKTASIGDILREKISGVSGIELAFIYGSYAGGEAHLGSDIDVMIVGGPAEKEAHRAVSEAEKGLHRRVNYSLYSREEIAKRLERRDNFIMTVFKHPKIFLKGNDRDGLFGITKQQPYKAG